jgi:PadR family transcriptional regulator, regulatory protein PadR
LNFCSSLKISLDTDLHQFYNVEQMAKTDTLGEFELLNLAALMMLGADDSYGMVIHEKVEELAEGRSVSLGSVYTTMDRLETKGYVRSWYAGATEERGGRTKRFFQITGSGELALKRSVKVANNILAGLQGIGGLA